MSITYVGWTYGAMHPTYKSKIKFRRSLFLFFEVNAWLLKGLDNFHGGDFLIRAAILILVKVSLPIYLLYSLVNGEC